MPGAMRPVAVTGLGIRSPLGSSAQEHWAGMVAGVRAVRHLPELALGHSTGPGWSAWCGAPVADPCLHHNVTAMAVAAAGEAMRQAGLAALGPGRVGVMFGGSKPVLSRRSDIAIDEWRASGSADALAGCFSLSNPARAIAASLRSDGPQITPSAACATGLLSIIRGAELIRDGACDVVVAGSADSSLHPAWLAAYRRMGVLATAGDDPGRCCRPFDARRSGFAVGEGAAALVLEDLEHARRRGAAILAELHGAGLTSDISSLVDVDVSGRSLTRALVDALARSDVETRDVDAISLHGTGTRLNDRAETAAVKAVFGNRADRLSCFSLKGAIGHLMGAAGSVETATLILAMQHGVVPATVNLETPDSDCDLDYTPGQPRSRSIHAAVKLSLGFGGTCAALVLRRPAWATGGSRG